MPANFIPGRYRIVTRDYRRPVGVDPINAAFQDVRLDLPVQDWSIELGGRDTLRFRISGYPSTGVTSDEYIKDKVFVSVNPQDDALWYEFVYQPRQDAYIIQRAGDPGKGWTVLPENSPNPHIVIRRFNDNLHDQLFVFEKIEE